MGLRRWGLGTDSGAIHGFCPGFLLAPIVDRLAGRGRREGVASVAIVAGAKCLLCLIKVLWWTDLSPSRSPHVFSDVG